MNPTKTTTKSDSKSATKSTPQTTLNPQIIVLDFGSQYTQLIARILR